MKSILAEPKGLTKANELMEILRERSIECGEAVGGIWILLPDDESQKLVESICLEQGTHLCKGSEKTFMSFQTGKRRGCE